MAKTPTNIAELRGNPGRRPLPEGEPQLELKLLPCPDFYHEDSIHRRVWDELALVLFNMGVLTEGDELALQWLVEPVAEYWHAWRMVYVEDLLGGDRSKVIYEPFYEKVTQGKNASGDVIDTYEQKFKPAVKLMESTWKRAQVQMIQFGMTPAARTKVKTMVKKIEDPMANLRQRNRGGK